MAASGATHEPYSRMAAGRAPGVNVGSIKKTRFSWIFMLLGIIWASPNSLLGLILGAAGLCTGGRCRVRGRVIEFYEGGTRWLIRRLPTGPTTMAMTLGHTVLGQTQASLDVSHRHEMVHVRQYECWGPFFLPAYGFCSLVMLLMGKHPYRDNPFERQAYKISGDL